MITLGSFFRIKKSSKELDEIIQILLIDMENNYKDAAQADLRRFENLLREKAPALNEKVKNYYEEQLAAYKKELAQFTHKDQKVTW